MAFDAHKNFAVTSVATAPVPALTGLSLVVAAGSGALFPATPFNCTVYPSGSSPLVTNAEIVTVTNITGDTFTIVRAQEGTAARAIVAGDVIANTATVKTFTDIESTVNAKIGFAVQSVSAGTQVASGPQLVFSNSNGVSFGISNSSVITASFSGGGGGGAAISAGTNSQNTGTVVFSNSNGITFGLSADGKLTASHNAITSQSVQTQGMVSINGSTGAIVFSNSNNVTFGVNASTITASVTVSQSAQTQSNVQGISAGTQVGRTGDIVFSNSNGITFGMSNSSIVTASYTVPNQSTQPVAASASNGSFLFSTLGFSNANGVTFGTSAGSIVTASVAVGGAAGTISAGASSVALGQVVFSNSNGVTFGMNVSTITASVGGAAAGTISAGASSIALGQVVFSNSNNVSFGLNGSTVTASATAASTQGSLVFGAVGSTNTGSQLIFSNSNNVSFGLNASTLTASATVASTQGSIKVSAGTLSQILSAINFNNSNGITFGLSNNSAITASHNGLSNVSVFAGIDNYNLSEVGSNLISFSNANGVSFGISNSSVITASVTVASTQGSIVFGAAGSTNTVSRMIFSNSNGVTFGLNGSTITASVSAAAGATSLDSYFANLGAFVDTQTGLVSQSMSLIFPFDVRNDITFDFLRMIQSGSVIAASTTAATTGNTQFSCGYTKSHNFVFYKRGSGASSASLQSYFSTQVVENYSHNVSAATNSTQFSYSQRYTFPCSTGTTGITQDYSSSAASLNFNSSGATLFTSAKIVDFKMGTTLSQGQWWLMYGQSSTSSSQFTSLGFRNIVTFNVVGVSQANFPLAFLGGATNSSIMPTPAQGSFSTAGGGTTASLGISAVSSSVSNIFPYIQLMVSA